MARGRGGGVLGIRVCVLGFGGEEEEVGPEGDEESGKRKGGGVREKVSSGDFPISIVGGGREEVEM